MVSLKSRLLLVDIESLCKGIDSYSTITRDIFKELDVDWFRKCVELVKRCLRDGQKHYTLYILSTLFVVQEIACCKLLSPIECMST